jgi:2,4-dienoyl-CoA reductase-like NADH-dependent reductase (Old Yellow Enzyme family)
LTERIFVVPQPLLFQPISIRGLTLKNRVVIAPMHQYSAQDGFAQDWHLMNVGRYAAGGAGLVFVESTKVDRRGCGTIGDLGAWEDAHVPGLKRLADIIRSNGAVPAIQLGHSGRKARRFRPWEGGQPLTREAALEGGCMDWQDWELVAPSAFAQGRDPQPRELSAGQVKDLVQMWGQAVRRCLEAGFEALEIHAAHGYLIHQFLSPVANARNDEYGGTEENRRRFLLEIVAEARRFWPQDKPLFVRLSVEDDNGFGPDESVNVAAAVAPLGVDVIDCSSGGMGGSPVLSAGPVSYGYQVPYAERLKRDSDCLSMAVGLIVHADQAEGILQQGQADLIAIAREAMYNPNWPMDAAIKLGADPAAASVPPAVGFWLDKRAASVPITPSTFGAGIDNLHQ